MNCKTVSLLLCILMFSWGRLPAEENPRSHIVRSSVDCYWGSGHGGSLTLVRLKEHADGRCIALRVSFSNGGYAKLTPRSKWKGDEYVLKTERASLPKNTYEKAKAICVKGLNNARHRDGSRNGSKRGTSVYRRFRSSADFLIGLRLLDDKDDDKHVEKTYCGYTDSAKQAFYNPLREASREIQEAIEKLEWQKSEDREITDFITDVLLAQSSKFKEDLSWWWPKERLVQMAGRSGNVRAIPILIQLLTLTRSGTFSDTPSVINRNLGYIVTSLDDITNKQLRFDDQGTPRALDDVVNDYLRLYAQQQDPKDHNKTDAGDGK